MTYDTIYMHQITREHFFSCFLSLCTFNQIFTTDYVAGIESIESLNRRGGGLHQLRYGTAYNVFVMLLFLQIIFMMYSYLLQDPRRILIAAKAAM